MTGSVGDQDRLFAGDLETIRADIAKAEEHHAKLPTMRQSLVEAEDVLQACEIAIRSDHPD